MFQIMNRKLKKPLIIVVIMLFLANTFVSLVNSVPKKEPAPVSYSYQDKSYGNQLSGGIGLRHLHDGSSSK